MIILEYIRLVCYAIVILSSLKGIAKRKFTNNLFVGDILMAFGLFTANALFRFGAVDKGTIGDWILTPVAILWAGIHFHTVIKDKPKK
jgi:hypothetical protein